MFSAIRKNRFLKLSLGAIFFVANMKAAHANIVDVTLECPTSISPGGTLNIKLNLVSYADTTIAKSGLIIHLGNLDVRGPYVIPISVKLNPFEHVTTEYLTTKFPTDAPKGIFSNIGVGVYGANNKRLGQNYCLIEVQ